MSDRRFTADTVLLGAFRLATEWDDEDVLHYANCASCDPLGGDEASYCPDSPRRRGEPPTKPAGELLHSPFRPELAAAFRPGASAVASPWSSPFSISKGAAMSEPRVGGPFRPADHLHKLYPTVSTGTWVARNGDGSALYVFDDEVEALRFVNREGYYLQVLLVPHGEDALRYRPAATP